MSVLPLKTYYAPGESLFSQAGAGTGQTSSFGDITCSTITVQDCQILFGDGTHISTIGGQLYYDNELIAMQSSLSSIGDWSLYPAISTIDMANYNISSASMVEAGLVQVHDPNLSSVINIQPAITSNYIYSAVVGAPAISYLTTSGTETSLSLVESAGPSTIGQIGINSTLGGIYMTDLAANVLTFKGGVVAAPGAAFSTLYANSVSTQTFTAVSTTVVQETISTLNIEADTANFSTLWGQPSSFYFSPISTISSLASENIVCSTLVAQTRVSTADLEVSSINGHEFTENTATISTIFSNNISSVFGDFQVNLTSTLQFNPSFNPNLDVNLGLGSLFGNLAGAALGGIGVLVGGAALGTGVAALTQARQTKTIGNSTFELVNAATQLQVSTVGTTVSSIQRLVSSISPDIPGEEIFVSTIIPAGTLCIRSYSDPLNTVSSPNSTIQYFGQWVSLADATLPPSTISTFSDLYTSSLRASTINFNNDTQLQRGACFGNSPSGVSTTELLWSGTSPPFDANLRLGQIILTGDDVGGINYSKDVLIGNANSGNRILVYGVGSGPSTIAYLSDIPAPVSNFQTASISSATISSINGGVPYTTANPPPVQPVVSSFQTASVSSATISSLNGGIPYTTAFPPASSENFSTLTVSTLQSQASTINIYNANLASLVFNTAGDITGVATNYINFQAQGTGGQLAGYIVNAGGVGSSSNYTTGPMFLNASSIRMSTNAVQMNNLSTNFMTLTQGSFLGLSTITFSTSTAAGSATQPAGRLVMGGNDLDLGQQDLWCQQVRLGAGNPSGSAQTEVIWYSPDNLTTRGLGVGGSDLTLRLQSTINSGTNNGYLLDTTINRPFFSTINAGTSTALIAQYPSTNLGNFGFSTLSVIPPLTYIASAYHTLSETVIAANTSTPMQWNTTSYNIGGFTIGTSTIQVPVAGVYEHNLSAQFDTSSGGTNQVQFWLTKNGAAVAQTNSIVSVVNNGRTLGTISIFDTAAAGDQYGWMFYSADSGMEVVAFAVGATPAIPSVIYNTKRIG